MRNFLTALGVLAAGIASAQAADVAVPTYKASPAPFSWTGFYLGLHGGAGWGNSDWQINSYAIDPFPPTLFANNSSPRNLNGFLGGVQAGFNLHYGPVVAGVEADWSGTNIKGKGSCFAVGALGAAGGRSTVCSTNADWFATVAGRLGATFDRTLLYVKGGGAWISEGLAFNMQGNGAFGVIQGPAASLSTTRAGWLIGAGVEQAFWDNWSAKIEYNYMDFGSKNYTFNDPGNAMFGPAASHYNVDIDQHVHVVKFGVNYRFGWR